MTDIQIDESPILSSLRKEGDHEVVEDLGEFENIITKLLEKIEIPSIKNSLNDRLIINKITSEGVYIITISKVAQLIFNNQEHRKYIEEKLGEVMEKSIAIHLTFENKENYFARKLEGL
ncbi:TPA: hypothetical protein DCZ39_01595 [Patescibacteria group bacterium]|nr:hypothetical protein [Candidatus Gracilibacteria bacterium]